jgi:hypothetical protein
MRIAGVVNFQQTYRHLASLTYIIAKTDEWFNNERRSGVDVGVIGV